MPSTGWRSTARASLARSTSTRRWCRCRRSGKRSDTLISSVGKRNLQDLEAQLTHRHLNFRDVARLLADQALADRAGGQDLVVVVILFARPHQVEGFLVAQVEILDLYQGAKDHGVVGQAVFVNE